MPFACLHCQISEILMRRQEAGDAIDVQHIGKLCEVIADIAVSVPPDEQAGVLTVARSFLDRFERDIADGTYSADRTLITSTGGRR